jgi:hypothetical protein
MLVLKEDLVEERAAARQEKKRLKKLIVRLSVHIVAEAARYHSSCIIAKLALSTTLIQSSFY